MLHIILTILKITGILLLVLVLLVAGLVLAALFVPLRYRLTAVHTQEETYGEARITWLLHLISVRVLFQPPSGQPVLSRDALQLRFRILGIDPAGVSSFLKKRKKKKRSKQRNAQGEKKQPKEETSSKKTPQKPENLPDENASPGENASPKESASPKENASPKEDAFSEKQTWENSETRQEKSSGEGPHTSEEHSTKTRFRSFCNTIKGIPKRLKSLKQKFLKILKTPGDLSRRAAGFRAKLEACHAKEVVQETFSRLKQMLRHYRIRKGKGYLRFGTGDPALTGELTGLLYMILPVSCGDILLEPQFTETMLETELEIAGLIRLIHVVTAAWWAFRNRRLRRLIHMLRSDK